MSKFYFLYDETPPTEETDENNTDTEDNVDVESLLSEDSKDKTFTQEDLNRIVSSERRKSDTQKKKLIGELEALKKSKNLTAQEAAQLNSQIDELKTSLMTKEQLAAENKKKMEAKHTAEIELLTKEKDSWKQRFTHSTIQRALIDGAVKAKAINPDQIIALLKDDTRVVEEKDDNGNGIGIFQPRVNVMEKDKEGGIKTLDLSVEEAITRMRDMPDNYGNLFKDLTAGGLGGTNQTAAGGSIIDAAKKSPEQYRAFRKQQRGN